jgi:hypothetical protein
MDNHCSVGFCVGACGAEDAEAAHIEGGTAISLSVGCFNAAEGRGAVIGVEGHLPI